MGGNILVIVYGYCNVVIFYKNCRQERKAGILGLKLTKRLGCDVTEIIRTKGWIEIGWPWAWLLTKYAKITKSCLNKRLSKFVMYVGSI